MNLREQELLEKIELNKQKRVQNASNESKLRAIEEEDAAYLVELEQLRKSQAEQEAAQQTRIDEATDEAAFFLDNLVIEGLTMRELCVDEPQYQMLRIAMQNKIIDLAEDFSKRISIVQTDEGIKRVMITQQLNAALKKIKDNDKEAYEDNEEMRQLRADLHQAKIEVVDYQGKLKNATDEIERLNSQVDDLRKEIAVGARNAYKVSDVEKTEQLKQLADQIKASRVHVYDVVPDNDINPKNYTARRVDNGEEVSWNWTQQKNFIEIKDAAEVERFRDEHAVKEVIPDLSLDQPVQNDVVEEITFPEIPSAIAPEVSAVSTAMVEGVPSEVGKGQTVEERLSALEAHVFGYVKQAVA